MITLNDLVYSLDDSAYNEFLHQTESTKGVKFSSLLKYIREKNYSEKEILEKLDVNSSSFYALKSRLFDKLKLFVMSRSKKSEDTFRGTSSEILAVTIDNDKTNTIVILNNLEKDYLSQDLHLELLAVYTALKRIYANTDKYYIYSQKYNYHLSLFIAINKGEELLWNFTFMLNNYLLSRDPASLELLKLVINELVQLSRVNNSLTLKLYALIPTISYSIKVEQSLENVFEDQTIEESLELFEKTTQAIPGAVFLKKNQFILNILRFDYYYLTKQYKKAAQVIINSEDIIRGISIFQHSVITHSCLLQINHLAQMERLSPEHILQYENELDILESDLEKDVPAFFILSYKAISYFNAKDFIKCIKTINTLINEHSFKEYCLAEIELKYLLCFALLKSDKTELIENYLKSINRKQKHFEDSFPYLQFMNKICKTCLKDKAKNKLEPQIENLKKELNSSHPILLHLVNFDLIA